MKASVSRNSTPAIASRSWSIVKVRRADDLECTRPAPCGAEFRASRLPSPQPQHDAVPIDPGIKLGLPAAPDGTL